MKMAKRTLAILMSVVFLFAFGFMVTADDSCTDCVEAYECADFAGCGGVAGGCTDCVECPAFDGCGGVADGCTDCVECPAFDGCGGVVGGCIDCVDEFICPDCAENGYDCEECNDEGCPVCQPANCDICGDNPETGKCYCCDVCGLPCCEIYAPSAPAFCECCRECWGVGCPECQTWWEGILQVLRIFTDWVAGGVHSFFQFLGWLLTPVHWFLRYVVFGWMFMAVG